MPPLIEGWPEHARSRAFGAPLSAAGPARSRRSIRDYRPSDFEPIWRLDQVCFAPGIAYSRSALRTFLSRKTAKAIVGERDGRIVAFVLGCRRGGAGGQVITLDVAPTARRHGLGRRLLAELENRFRDTGVRRVRLQTAVDNAAAIAFYERLGYQRVAHLPGYYGPGLHAWEMEKVLAHPSAHFPSGEKRRKPLRGVRLPLPRKTGGPHRTAKEYRRRARTPRRAEGE